MGLDEVIRIARRRTREHAHTSSLRHEQITDHCLDFGFEEHATGAIGRRRIVSLATAPAQASLFAVSRSPATSDAPRSSSASRRNSIHRLRAVAQLMDSPAQRVRGRVFAREQHGHEISENHVVGKRPAVVIACRQHGLQEIRRLLGSAWLGREARSLGDYQLAEPSPELRKSAVQTTIPREPDEPPRRKQREQPAIYRWKHELELALNDVVPLLDGVDVAAEGDERRNVHRETLELVDDIERRAGVRQPFPALFQAGGDGLKLRIQASQVTLGQRQHGESSLRVPGVALGRKNSVDAHFERYGSNAGIPGEDFGWRTVANVLSTGFDVRRCFQCSAGKS
jgi:hypothetical protein